MAEKKFFVLRSCHSSVDSLLLPVWSTFDLTLSLDYASPLSTVDMDLTGDFCQQSEAGYSPSLPASSASSSSAGWELPDLICKYARSAEDVYNRRMYITGRCI